MTEQEFIRISTYLKGKYGIDMTRKKEIMTGRLENYVKQEGWKSYSEYMDALEMDFTGNLEKALVNMLTTNHTYFMREPEHFDYLRKEILPVLKKKEERRKDLRIWCGASSSGEEPYTLAMILVDFFGLEHGTWDTKVLATDISTNVLKQAMQGIYSIEQVEAIPDAWKRRFFRRMPDSDQVRVTDELKNEVLFRKFNLMDAFPFRQKMHVIFLRNVMIYFDERTKNELLRKVYEALEPGGYLFIGRTETLNRDVIPFKMVSPSIYVKEE